MTQETKQTEFWKSQFGKDYTDRCTFEMDAWNELYLKQYGRTKLQMNDAFLGDLPRDIKILEVGCNVGNQLRGLQFQGFEHLYGIELQWYAVENAKKLTERINIIQGSALELPFRDGYFDLVFTSGVLIHMAPDDLPRVMQEIGRVSSRYIWGHEYYAEDVTEISYRGNQGYLWKADYGQLYLENLSGWQVVKKELVPYINEEEKGNVDCLYLLERRR